jgi:pyridoxal 5'-phosphate synthase pdxT subunit
VHPVHKVGILALQGAVGLHAEALRALGAAPVEVRTPGDLAGIEGLVIPGGESTTLSRLLELADLFEPIADLLADGLPAFGTCAGMILLAADVLDGRPDQRRFGAVDVSVRRNAFGRQVDSFEAPITVDGLPGAPFPAVFIRAPVVERVGEGVEVLARIPSAGRDGGGRAVLCRQGHVLVAAFHPELSGDLRLHQRFLSGT